MANKQLKDDLTTDDALEGGLSGQIVPSEDGYNKVSFTDTTRVAVESVFKSLIDTTLKDYSKLDAKREKNLKAHEGKPEQGQTIVIPIAKRDTNQQLAWILNTLLKDPMITVRPLEAGHVQILTQNETGQMVQTTISSEDEARDIGLLVNFYLRDKVGFKKTIKTWVAEMLRDGNRPPVLKVIHEPVYRNVASVGIEELGEPTSIHDEEGNDTGKREQVVSITKSPEFKRVVDGEPTRIECIPGDRFFVPFPEYDIQRAPFVFQDFEEDTATIKGKIADGTYDFCGHKPDADELELVLSGEDKSERQKQERLDGRTPSEPFKRHRMFEVWFYFPFANGQTDMDGSPLFDMKSFCAVFHWPSKRFLNCYENPYWHGLRPFFAGFMQQRPFSFTGYSTTENVAPFQRLISQLFHLQIQNVVAANVQLFFARRTSSTFKFLQGRKLRPGLVVPFDDPDDINPKPLGTTIGSMSAEISFLNSESEKMSVVTQYDRGNIPSRTPAATVNAVESLAKMQPAMVLDEIRDTIGEVVKTFVQTLAQYSPEGIAIPFEEPITRAVVERFIRFPRQLLTDQFAFEVTATAEDDTPEARFTKGLQISGQISAFNQELMGIGGAIWKPGVPPPVIEIGTTMILGKRAALAQMLKDARLNPDDFLPREEEIRGVAMKLLQMNMMMQMQQQAAGGPPPNGGPPEGGAPMMPPQMGGMGAQGLPAAGGGGALPPTGGVGVGPQQLAG